MATVSDIYYSASYYSLCGAPAGRPVWEAASLVTRPRQTATRREDRATAGWSAPPVPAICICDNICDQAGEDGGWCIAGYGVIDSGAHRDQADEDGDPTKSQQ